MEKSPGEILRERKKKLESELFHIITAFETETGVSVDAIDIRQSVYNGVGRVYSLEIKLSA